MKSNTRVILLAMLASVCYCVTPVAPPTVADSTMKCECTCTQVGSTKSLYKASGNFVGNIKAVSKSVVKKASMTSIVPNPTTTATTKQTIEKDIITPITIVTNATTVKTNVTTTATTKTVTTNEIPEIPTINTTTYQPNATTQEIKKETFKPRIRFMDVVSDDQSFSFGENNILSPPLRNTSASSALRNKPSEKEAKITPKQEVEAVKTQKLKNVQISGKMVLSNKVMSMKNMKKMPPIKAPQLLGKIIKGSESIKLTTQSSITNATVVDKSPSTTTERNKAKDTIASTKASEVNGAATEGEANIKAKIKTPKYRLPLDDRKNERFTKEPSAMVMKVQQGLVIPDIAISQHFKKPIGILSGVIRSEFKNTFNNQEGYIIESISKVKKVQKMNKQNNMVKTTSTAAPKSPDVRKVHMKNEPEMLRQKTSNVAPNPPDVRQIKNQPTKIEKKMSSAAPDPQVNQQWSTVPTTTAGQWQQETATPSWTFGQNWNVGYTATPGPMWRDITTTTMNPRNNPDPTKPSRNLWMVDPSGHNMQGKNQMQVVTAPTTVPMPPSMTLSGMEQMGGQGGMGMEVQPPEVAGYNMQGMPFQMGEFQMSPYFYNQQMKK